MLSEPARSRHLSALVVRVKVGAALRNVSVIGAKGWKALDLVALLF